MNKQKIFYIYLKVFSVKNRIILHGFTWEIRDQKGSMQLYHFLLLSETQLPLCLRYRVFMTASFRRYPMRDNNQRLFC